MPRLHDGRRALILAALVLAASACAGCLDASVDRGGGDAGLVGAEEDAGDVSDASEGARSVSETRTGWADDAGGT